MTTSAFFLVTVSSGLFVTGAFTQPSNLTQLSWFLSSFDNNDSTIQRVASDYNLIEPLHYSQDDGEVTAHLISNGIIELNLSYPAWTSGELAFPLLPLSDTSTTHAIPAASVSAEIPAIRAAVHCDVLTDDEVSISYQSRWDDSLGKNFTFQLATVESPLLPQFQSCQDANNFKLQANLPGRLSTSEGSIVAPRPCSSTGIYCSNLTGIYGYATDEAFVNYSVVSCRVSYEQVATTAAFELPSYVISKDAPPTVDETQTKPLNSSDVNNFLNSVGYFAAFYNTSITTFNGYSTMDSVTTALIYGKDGVPIEQVFQKPPDEHLIPSLRHMIRVMAAQYMSYFYRTANSSMPLVGSTIPATLQVGPDFRLKQNATSTRVLDVLLVVSWLFAMITVFTFRSRDIAKAQPGTLAAALALVSDSEFVYNMQTRVQSDLGGGGTERDNSLPKSIHSVQVEQELLSEGSLFSLGWWRDTTGPGDWWLYPVPLPRTVCPCSRQWAAETG
ncbi:uncharacterized protein A1O5_09992 [Cladophialophora psammophila CBS 110553]|uniref:Uncharacterized protein n=1 Tax=Cladophialophora psammophila CBS 110553 TaxID=1182543 RepID=W9WFA9_9EURO|nr:uncharacterized protein A1O5_09992 [Cladophialophora psammophila CBS 110553]EXJ66797.1 hypothetical protein A1O5_09992 [Cladophialophora psammophila CBS 110553]